jgi:hypothetical protein
MTDLHDDLSRLGNAPPPTAEVRDAARNRLGHAMDAAATGTPTAEVHPLDRRRRARRGVVRAAVAATAAAAVAAVTLVLPDDNGVVGTPEASAAVLLEQAAAQVEATEAPRLPMRIDSVISFDASMIPGATAGRITQKCSQYVLTSSDALNDCERNSNGYGVMFGTGMPNGVAAVAMAESPEAAVAALDRTVAANVEEQTTQGLTTTAEEVRVEILSQTLQVPQMHPAIRAEMVRQLATAPDLQAEEATTATGAHGTRFTATFPQRWILAITIDEAGFVREVTYQNPSGTPWDNTISMEPPVAVEELPAEVAAYSDQLIAQAREMSTRMFDAPAPTGDTSLSYTCTVTGNSTPDGHSGSEPVTPGREISAMHCSSPG